MDLSKLNAPDKVLHLTYSFIISQCLYIAVKLEIADILAKGEKNIEELSKITRTNEDFLYRVLRLLVSVGVFKGNRNSTFALSPESAFLRKDFPGTLSNFILMIGQDWHWKTWGNFLSSIKSGKPTIEEVYGVNAFDFLENNKEAGNIMDKVLDDVTVQLGNFLLRSYDFSKTKTIIDVGGGKGSLLAPVAIKYKHIQVIVYELPRIENKINSKTNNRIKYVKGDFFKSIPKRADLYIMKNILHDWDDAHAKKILKNVHSAMAENSNLLIIESLVPENNELNFSKFHDLEMLVIGGKERTLTDFKKLLHPEFKLIKNIPLAFSQNLMEFTITK